MTSLLRRIKAILRAPIGAAASLKSRSGARAQGVSNYTFVRRLNKTRSVLAPLYRRSRRWLLVVSGLALFCAFQYWIASEVLLLRWWFVLVVFMVVIAVSVAMTRPMVALILWFTLSPIASKLFRLDFGTGIPAISYDRVALYLLAASTISRALIERRPMRNLHAGESLLIAFALYTSVAGLFFTYESVTYFVYQVLIRIGDLLALYFVTRACITRKEHVLWILTALVAMGFLYSWMGFYDHFTGRMSLTALIGVKAGLVYGDVGGRAAGPFLSPAHLGMFMGMAALVAVHLAVSQRNTVVKLLLYAAAVPMIFAWFWTYTRGGYLLLLVGLALMPFFAVSTRRAYALILGVLVAVGVVVVPFAMTNKDVENRLTNEGTARSRIVAGNALINLVKHHPLFGVGVGNGNKEMIKYVTSVGAAPGLLIWEGMGSWPKRFELPEHTSSHSTYLTILADHGVIGGVLFFGALAALLVRMWRTRRVLPYSGPLGRDIAALLVAITVGYALSINTTRVEQSEYISLVAWLLVASLIQLGEIVRKESREPAVTDAEPDESSRVRVLAGGRS